MSKFIRLSTFLLNTNDIQKIMITPNNYCIHVVGKQISGFSYNFGLFGTGYIQSYTSEIEVCKTKHSKDYKIVTEWMNQNYPLD
jgi:hypothetical protein